LLFSLENSESLIILNSVLTTVGEALRVKRESTPTAEINYHELTDVVGTKFTLNRKHHIVFIPQGSQPATEEEEGVSSLQASAAALIPPKAWETKHTQMVWSMTWKSKGLMPIRPQIIFSFSGEIGAGQALMLCGTV
jgi:hypothetical protein